MVIKLVLKKENFSVRNSGFNNEKMDLKGILWKLKFQLFALKIYFPHSSAPEIPNFI